MKNLLILIDADFVGGAETNYKYILPVLEQKGWNPVFITHGQKNLKQYFDSQDIPVRIISTFEPYYSLTENGRFSLRNLVKNLVSLRRNKSKLKKIAETYEPLAIISNSMISHWLLSSVGSKYPFKKVMHLHDIVNRKRVGGLYGFGLDRITSRMDQIIVVSEAVKKILHPRVHHKTIKLYNPVDPNPSPGNENPQRDPGTIRIGMFARYAEWKGHRDFLKIANELKESDFEFVCYGNMAGQESYFEELLNLARSLENRNRIHLYPFSNRVAEEMAKCDLILHLSGSPEPFGRVLIEANALRKPVYAYAGGGTGELFEELKLAGVLVPSNDYKAMATQIRRFPDQRFEFPSLDEISPEAFVTTLEKILLNQAPVRIPNLKTVSSF